MGAAPTWPDGQVPPLVHTEGRVLSIQSHTVYGHVGNKCAVLPLQLHGFDVDAINSVQFSNHTGYPTFKGTVMSGADLGSIMEGLRANNLIKHTHLLTGYIGSLSLLQGVKDVLLELRRANPDLVYVCDPVMGDEGRLYVSRDLVNAFRDEVMPLATVLTPNQYETELLTGLSVRSVEDALAACRAIHACGPSTVVITSLNQDVRDGGGINADPSPGLAPGEEDEVVVVASHMQRCADGVAAGADAQQQQQQYAVRLSVPRLAAYFTGTGDLFAALLLAWLSKYPGDLAVALEHTVAGVQAVLAATVRACPPDLLASGLKRGPDACAGRELRLVQAQHSLVHPPISAKAQRLPTP